MSLERPVAATVDNPELLKRWLYNLWVEVSAPSSGINETNHAALGNLNSISYTHLTANQSTGLTTGNNTQLHYHAADRDRTNHIGTQVAATISDLATAIPQVKGTFGVQGAAITAANNLTTGNDGDYFQVSGNTQINLLDASNWLGGSWITLKFNGTPTVKHNQAVSGVFKPIMLAGAADYVTTANDTLTLRYDSTDALWYETSRAVI